MECELLIPVEPAKDYDKLLMFKRAKALHPEIPDLDVAGEITELLNIDQLKTTLREYGLVDSVSAPEATSRGTTKIPSPKTQGPSRKVADFGQAGFSKVKIKLEALETASGAGSLPPPKKILPPEDD